MTFQVTAEPSGHRFEVQDDETVLAAALRSGVGLPHGCKNGACGSCKGRIAQGRVRHEPHQASALSADEEARGLSLFCRAHPESDLVIEVREVRGIGDIPIKKMPARVAALSRPAPDVAVIRLQLPASERMQYLPGQYVEIILKDGRRRSYSMAGAPETADQLELHVRHTPGGAFSDHVFGAGASAGKPMKERDILRLEGPLAPRAPGVPGGAGRPAPPTTCTRTRSRGSGSTTCRRSRTCRWSPTRCPRTPGPAATASSTTR